MIPGLRGTIREWSGALFHLIGGAFILLLWRFMSMPDQDGMGLLVPLAWVLTGLLYGRGSIATLSITLLGMHVLLALLWMASPRSVILARASSVGALFPGLGHMASSRGRWGRYLLFAIPLVPMVILTVPFSGDEPFHATHAERMVSSETEIFGGLYHQRGDPSREITHQQILYPAFLVPGYPFGIPGVRMMAVLMALGSMAVLGVLLSRKGIDHWRMAVFLGLLTVPGIGIFGTVYPCWLAILIFVAAASASIRTRSFVWPILATVILAMLKLRFAPLGIGLAAAAFISTPGKRKYTALLWLMVTGALFLLFDDRILQGRFFWARYGNSEALRNVIASVVFRPHEVLFAATGSLLDTEAGLLWKSPWVILGLAGIPALRREHPDLYCWLGLPALFYAVTLFLWTPTDWHGAPTPVGRMLVPVLPFLLVSMTMKLKSRPARSLIALSLMVSSLLIAFPGLRFNDADGSDLILSSLFGNGSSSVDILPSIVRPTLLPFVVFGGIAVLLVWLALKNGRGTVAILLASSVLIGTSSRGVRTSWEAEELDPALYSGCEYYPANMDPFNRKFWFECRQVFLSMGQDGDEVMVPIPSVEDDSLTIRMHYRTLMFASQPWLLVELEGQVDTLCGISREIPPPERFFFVTGGKDKKIENEPGNMQLVIGECNFQNPGEGSVLIIRPLCPSAGWSTDMIYLDRLELVL